MVISLGVQGMYRFHAKDVTQAASYEAARIASITTGDPTTEGLSAAYNYGTGLLPEWQQGGRVFVEIFLPNGTNPKEPVTVRVTYDPVELFNFGDLGNPVVG